MNRVESTASAAMLALLAGLAGCSTVSNYREPRVDFNAPPPPAPTVSILPPASAGAVFNVAAYRPLFEDHRARLPGDSLIVTIVERISASQKSTSSVERSGALKAGVTAVPGLLASTSSLARANAAGTSSNTHDGKGSTEASNEFQGTITVIVTGVLPNGHLLIQGEKQIGLNANVDVLRFTGQVDPRTIQPGNSVASTAIANVRLQQQSKGQAADAQVMGLVSRFFLNVLPI
jgi:flagellar L-ring protein precursor FlgH